MKTDIVSVTDHIKNFSVEKQILCDYFQENIDRSCTIALVWHQTINDSFLAQYPSIRALVRYGVGYDNIDLELCKRKKIIVANNPDYGVDEVSDTCLSMILALTRKINAFQKLAKEDNEYWLGKNFNLNIQRINTLSLGIIGLGRIGASLARKFLSLSKNVGFYDPYLPSGYEKIFNIKRYDNLYSLLANSDIVSINTPLNDETSGMVDEKFLDQMKYGSYLVNCSRGKIVKDQNLILEKLASNQLEGYGTDVWHNEPPSSDDINYGMWKNNSMQFGEKLIITPHTAYYSEQALEECRSKACKICLDIIQNKQIRNRIV